MKHHLKRQLRRLATERPYQIVAASAAALALATATGALLTTADDAPAGQRTATTVAEMRSDVAASRGEARDRRPPRPAPRRPRPPRPPAPRSPAAKASEQPGPDPQGRAAEAARRPRCSTTTTRRRTPTTTAARRPPATRSAPPASTAPRTSSAAELGTTEMGTNSAEDTTRVLNAEVKGSPYRTRMFAGAPSPAQMDRLQADVVEGHHRRPGRGRQRRRGRHRHRRRLALLRRRPLHRRGGLQGQRPHRADRRLGEPGRRRRTGSPRSTWRNWIASRGYSA